MKTELQYRTFDQLLNEVATDFVTYSNEGMIEPGQLIKVAQRVNYDLGLRIHGTKEKVLDIEKKKTKLPDDFYVLNYAHLCGRYTVTTPVMAGRETENVILDPASCATATLSAACIKCGQPDPKCICERTYTVECKTGEKVYVQVVEKRKHETRTYNTFERMHIATSSGRIDALNDTASGRTGYIKNGFIYTNVDEGQLFISYQGALEDDGGNLLVLDHPVINEYYEYAMKQRILENLYINGEDVSQRMQLIEQRLRGARNNALSIVNTPNFAEMYKVWQMNRKAQYNKYYDMFKSTDGF
jgi:hypothetical protein